MNCGMKKVMNYRHYLKNRFFFYVISGMILGLMAFSFVMIHRYNNHLSGMLADIKKISHNKDRIKTQIRDIDSIIDYFKDELNMDMASVNAEAQIFQSLDDMKANLQDATVTVTSLKEFSGSKPVPVEIEAPVRS